MSVARPVFWLSGAATAWVLAGYPAVLSLLPAGRGRPATSCRA